jgi:hypothetical protein
MTAPLTSFELFPLLPVELRNEIFAAAIQPRLVRINQHITKDPNSAKYDEIMQLALKKIAEMDSSTIDDPPKTYTEILAGMLGPNCNPKSMLRCFRDCTHRWRNPQNQPGTHTATCKHLPHGIDFCLLERYGRSVIERTMRTYHFRSLSPIPALLHTCRESRRTMQLCGYELAFPFHRSIPPSIWFNFKYDALHLGSLSATEVRQLPSKDLFRVERLAIQEDRENYLQLLPEILPLFRQLKELLWIVHQFYPLDAWRKSYVETGSNLWGYIECDTPEFMSEDLYRHARMSVWAVYAQQLLAYLKNNEGSGDGFFALKDAEMENRFREHRDSRSGQWPIPKWKHVFIVTKEQAGHILALREKVVKDMGAIECLENEEGPQQVSYAPFDDECEVLQEIADEERYMYYY